MTEFSMAGSDRLATATARKGMRRYAAAGIATATIVNAAIWIVGVAAGASFSVTLAVGDIVHEISLLEVIAATALALAAGYGVVAVVARRSPGAARAVVVAGGVFGVASAGGALTFANDIATAMLLATMHLAATVAFVVAARGALARNG